MQSELLKSIMIERKFFENSVNYNMMYMKFQGIFFWRENRYLWRLIIKHRKKQFQK